MLHRFRLNLLFSQIQNPLFVILLVFTLWTSCDAIDLLYEPNKSVTQVFESVSSLSQKSSGLEMRVVATQKQVFDLEIISQEGESEFKGAPFQLKYTLRSMKTEINANGSVKTFDTNVVSDSPEIAAISFLVGKPLTFQVNKDYTVDDYPKEWKEFSSSLPLLHLLFPKGYFPELFATNFAFAGRDLKVGETSNTQRILGDQLGLNIPIRFELQKINYKEAEAEIGGKYSEKGKKISEPLDSGLIFDGNIAMESTVSGQSKWNRRQGLECNSTISYELNGEIVSAAEKIPFSLQFSETLSSQPK
jgi:hypothetical protein